MPESTAYKAQVREEIYDAATLDAAYFIMNMLAAAIASYGLLSNSAAVVIGAMIVAMLLGPIGGLGLSVADADLRRIGICGAALFAGVAAVMATAGAIGFVHRAAPLTDQIMARTAPNLFDLMIALTGGAAGAYATISPRLKLSVVGVAIATALVPPLATSAILFVRGDFVLARGAFLLAFANMAAIQFAFSAVLWISGFRRGVPGDENAILAFAKRDAISLAMLLGLALALANNLHLLLKRETYEAETKSTIARALADLPGDYLAEVRFGSEKGTAVVDAVVRGPAAPTPTQVAAIESQLPAALDDAKPQLRIRFVETTTIGRDGPIYERTTYK